MLDSVAQDNGTCLSSKEESSCFLLIKLPVDKVFRDLLPLIETGRGEILEPDVLPAGSPLQSDASSSLQAYRQLGQ
jgi:hypothetical protein